MSASPRIWIIDAGNSQIKAARWENGAIVDVFHMPRIAWESDRSAAGKWESFAARFPAPADGLACALARGTDEEDLGPLIAALPSRKPPFILRPEGPLPFKYVYTSGRPGADRLANAAALGALSPGHAAIAVDFGTATHIEAVDSQGDFAGGVILPGIRLQFDVLSPATAGRLPQLNTHGSPAARVLNDSTDGAIRSGILLGMAGAVEKLVAMARRELGNTAAPVYTTGGGAAALKPLLDFDHHHEPHLTVLGIARIWALICGQGRQ